LLCYLYLLRQLDLLSLWHLHLLLNLRGHWLFNDHVLLSWWNVCLCNLLRLHLNVRFDLDLLLLLNDIWILLICRVRLKIIILLKLRGILYFIFGLVLINLVSIFFRDVFHVILQHQFSFGDFHFWNLRHVTRLIIVLAMLVHHEFRI
jgi:hypothetical protein